VITYTQDANFVMKKWSTWLAIAAAALFAGVQYWESLPSMITSVLPEWLQGIMALAGLICAVMVPVATSIQQKSIPVIVPEPSYTQYYPEEMP